MAETDFTIQVPDERFSKATLKLEGARDILKTIGILLIDTPDGEVTIAGHVLGSAMNGIDLLIESAVADLSPNASGEVAA